MLKGKLGVELIKQALISISIAFFWRISGLGKFKP